MPNARKRSDIKSFVPDDYIITEEDEIEETISIMLHRNMIFRIKGEATGKRYIFNGSGSIVEVDKEDVEGIMRSNRRKKSCCGSFSSPYFSIV